MIPEIKVFFRTIDPKALSLFTRRFLEKEMEAHGIKEVAVTELLSILRDQPGIYDPSEKKIVLDPTYPVDEMMRRLKTCCDLDLTVDEAWAFVFWHEASHADPNKSQAECDRYARERIIQHREGNR
jgi:hypothetical protein